MNQTLRQFYDALNAEERDFVPALQADNLGLIMRSAINELDWYYYNMAGSEEPSAEQQEQYYLLCLGVTRLIKIALEARASFDVPVVMFPRDRRISVPVLEIVSGLGMIEHGRRIAQSVSSGLCRIEKTGSSEFHITLPAIIVDEAYYERAISEHYRTESRRQFAKLLNSKRGRKLTEEIKALLTELVYPFETHFIGYGGDPRLDDYFYGLAFSEIQLYDGYDTFNYKIEFGGIAFQKYILALTYFVSLSIRHERFAEALSAKDSSIRLENVLTISSDRDGFVESIKDALDKFGSVYESYEETSLEEARRILEVLSVSRKNTGLLDRPASALPLIVQSSDTGLIRCIAGARNSPMQFLLDSLRYHFPRDYDKNQQSREASLQTAIKGVLNEGFAGLRFHENIKVRLDGRELTDIDLVVIEEATGTVILCQLKYQDLYGADLHSMHVRTTRLKEQTAKWLAALNKWMDTAGTAGLKASLRLPGSYAVSTVHRLIISKHYGYPLKDLADSPDTASANWIQFFNSIQLVQRNPPDKRSVNDLIHMLRSSRAPGGQQEHAPEPRSEWIIRDLKFTVEQEGCG